MTKLFLSGLFVSVSASTVVYFARKSYFSDKVLHACFPLALYLVISNLFALFIEGFGVWEQARLVPTFAFYKDIQVYSTVQQGSVQTTIYPPVWVLSYLPIVFSKSPTAAMMMGRILAQTYTLLPVLLLLMLFTPQKRIALILFAVFIFAAVELPSLKYSCFRPHADAPSLGFSLLAFIFLLKIDEKKGTYEFLFSILSLTIIIPSS